MFYTTYTQQIDEAAKELALLHGRDWSDMGTYEREAYRDEVAKVDIHLRWDIERPGVFVGRVGASKIVGRVVQNEDGGWELRAPQRLSATTATRGARMLGAQADWTWREEARKRIGNVRRMLKFAWLAAQYDSAVFSAVFLNSARQEGDDLIAYVKRNGRTYNVGDRTITTLKRGREGRPTRRLRGRQDRPWVAAGICV